VVQAVQTCSVRLRRLSSRHGKAAQLQDNTAPPCYMHTPLDRRSKAVSLFDVTPIYELPTSESVPVELVRLIRSRNRQASW